MLTTLPELSNDEIQVLGQYDIFGNLIMKDIRYKNPDRIPLEGYGANYLYDNDE